MNINVPLSVPKKMHKVYKRNFKQATFNTGRLFLFAGDQKIEHLNDDFAEKFHNTDPEHLFKIANQSPVGVFAAHLGLISRYGQNYKKIPYIVKLNGKSNLVKTQDPLSQALWTVDDVCEFKQNSSLNILGIGYTIYLGSEYENIMVKEAAQIINDAHQNGMLAVIWIYPRGKNVKNEKSIDILAGAAGLGLCLGADFVKLNYPFGSLAKDAEKYKAVVKAAGNTGIICSGGSKVSETEFLKRIKNQISISGVRGAAIGRNLHQNDLKTAINLAKKIKEITTK